MKEIPLTQGCFATVDDDVFPILMQYKWHTHRSGSMLYARRWNGEKHEYMHWYVAGYPLKGYVIDHRNKNGLDETSVNVRVIPRYQNQTNPAVTKTCLFPGVQKIGNSYRASITFKRQWIDLGFYKNEFTAFMVYRMAVLTVGREMLPEHEKIYQKLCELNFISKFNVDELKEKYGYRIK